VPQSVFNLPEDTEIPDPKQSQDTQLPVGSMRAKRNVRWYREGASLEEVEGGVSIRPIGQFTLATLFGEADTNRELHPGKCYVSAPNASEGGFDLCHPLGRRAETFGSLEEDKGSLTCLKEGVVVDSERVIHGADTAIDLVEYGPMDNGFLPGYRLAK
jgi:hypothetical protein